MIFDTTNSNNYKMKTKFSGILTLLLAFVVQFSFAQEKTISGTVSDESGLPLPGTTVLVKGTTNGTSTDFDGKYTINTNEGAVLVFSFVGYTTQEVTVGAANTINITLAEDAQSLEEVVVTAQGIKREKKALGYAVTTLKSESVENRPEADIARVLSGKVAGVNVVGTGGLAGSGTNIRIRGNVSITGNNQPLFVINGVPFNTSTNAESNVTTGNGSGSASSRFLDLDPNNIESMSVLKGLSATTLYGNLGRNGVILITTKTGAAGDADKGFEVSVNQSVFFNEISSLPDYQNTYGQGGDNSENVGFVGNWGARFDRNITVRHHYNVARLASAFPEFQGVNVLYQPFENNIKDFFRQGTGRTTSINVSKGSERASINFNFGHTDEDGYVRGNNIKRTNFGLGGSAKLSNRITVAGSFNFTTSNFITPPVSANNGTGNFSIFTRTLFIPRNFDLNGLPYQDPFTGANVYYRTDQENPNWLIDNSQESIVVNRFYNNISSTYALTDNLNLTYRVGFDTFTEKQQFYVNKGGVSALIAQTGFLKTTSATNTIWDHSLILTLGDFKVTDKIGLNATVGANAYSETFDKFGVASTNQVVFNFIDHNNFTTQSNQDPLGSQLDFKSKQNILGLYGQFEFDYDNFLYVTLAGRNDWSSTVEQVNKSLFYPSASVAVIPTAAIPSLKSDALNFLKLRFGYGTSAGYPGPYRTRQTLALGTAAFTTGGGRLVNVNSSGSLSNAVDVEANPNLKAELHTELEAGIEARLFNNKVNLELSVFTRDSKDQILTSTIPFSTGFERTSVNAGKIQNQGIEVDLSVKAIDTDNFKWNSNFVFTASESEVKELPAGDVFMAGFSNLGNYAIEGQPLGVIKGSFALRDANGNFLIDPTTGDVLDSSDLGIADGIIGDPNPDWQLTTINSFSFKGFTLSAQVEYVHGGDFSSNTINNLLRRGVTKDTEDREGTFITPGFFADPNTGIPLLDANGNQIPNNIQQGTNEIFFLNYVDTSDNQIFDGSTVRLREISLTYTLPKKFLKKTPFGSVSFMVNGQNLWFWSPNIPKYTNFDPETLSTGVGNGLGLDFQTAPTSKKYGFTVKATF